MAEQKRAELILHKDGDLFGIATTISTVEEFLEAFACIIDDMIAAEMFACDWLFQLQGWFPLAFNLCKRIERGDILDEKSGFFISGKCRLKDPNPCAQFFSDGSVKLEERK
jgi:hypothetical protein